MKLIFICKKEGKNNDKNHFKYPEMGIYGMTANNLHILYMEIFLYNNGWGIFIEMEKDGWKFWGCACQIPTFEQIISININK